jgi:hypothetical protein
MRSILSVTVMTSPIFDGATKSQLILTMGRPSRLVVMKSA